MPGTLLFSAVLTASAVLLRFLFNGANFRGVAELYCSDNDKDEKEDDDDDGGGGDGGDVDNDNDGDNRQLHGVRARFGVVVAA